MIPFRNVGTGAGPRSYLGIDAATCFTTSLSVHVSVCNTVRFFSVFWLENLIHFYCIQTGIVRELHGMQNGFRCSDKGEPGDRGEKGDKGEDGVSIYLFLPKISNLEIVVLKMKKKGPNKLGFESGPRISLPGWVVDVDWPDSIGRS